MNSTPPGQPQQIIREVFEVNRNEETQKITIKFMCYMQKSGKKVGNQVLYRIILNIVNIEFYISKGRRGKNTT